MLKIRQFFIFLTIFNICILCLLKKVEIVIINSLGDKFERKSPESFGKSTAYILCTVHACADKLCFLVFRLCYFYSSVFNYPAT